MIDLFCGLGGWASGGLAEGYDVVGFDIERHAYGEHRYPAQLVVQDVLTLHGSQFRGAALIVASPPCQEYSYMAMPWSKAKAIAADYRSGKRDVKQLTALFDACFRIQREACEAAGRHIPLVVENVKGAQPWVGRSRWAFGSFHLWGDVPALMPMTLKAVKVPGMGAGWRPPGHPDHRPGLAFNPAAQGRAVREGRKQRGSGAAWFDKALDERRKNPDGRKNPGIELGDIGGPGQKVVGQNPAGRKLKDQDGYERAHQNAFGWKSPRTSSSDKAKRKFASAMIAKIPLPLSRHIAATYRPT